MQYELYIDIFFCVNFMMDYLLLMFLKKMLSCTATHGNIAVGAAAGATLTCVVTAIPFPYVFMKILLFHSLVNIIMLKIGLRIKWGRDFLKAYIFLYVGGFLLGGIMGGLKQYLRAGSLFFVLCVLGYSIASGIWELIAALMKQSNTQCMVLLWRKDRQCKVRALIDTGNRLREPVSKRPVSIIDRETAEKLGIENPGDLTEEPQYVSYHSIGNRTGTLPVFVLDKMCLIKGKTETEFKMPLVAVCEDEIRRDGYEMILNPDIYIGGNK